VPRTIRLLVAPVVATIITAGNPSRVALASPRTAAGPQYASATRQGYSLTANQAQQLEEQLQANPEDLTSRAKLLGYWFSRGRQDAGLQTAITARRRHILWMVANHPDSELCGIPEATVDRDARYNRLADSIGYEQTRQLWIEQTSKRTVKASTLANAGFFFKLPDKPLAASIYGRLEGLEPGNPQWKMLRGRVLAYALIGLAAINQNGFALALDPAEAGSEFAKQVRSDLESSTDVMLLTGVSAVLNTQGVMVARDRAEVLRLAEHYANRAQELDPTTPALPVVSSRQLAETLALRAMQSRDPAERAGLLHKRLELLEKSYSNISPDDHAHASELLDLARARADAGDMAGAADLAGALLRLAPQIETDPETRGLYDQVRHHAHVIVGRSALRMGDLTTASQELLAAGKVAG